MSPSDRPLVWLHGEVKSPPFTQAGRLESEYLLRRLQRGEKLHLPHSRPMPSIGSGVNELRVNDQDVTWRIAYRADDDAVVIVDVFAKKTQATPKATIATCKKRLKEYDDA